MENNSKNPPRRGRPAKYPAEFYEKFGTKISVRAKQNYWFALGVADFLEKTNPELFAEILPPKRRNATLGQLGRLLYKKKIFEAASHICDKKLNSRQAAYFIQRLRGKGRDSTLGLGDAIFRAVEDYKHRSPDLSNADIAEVFENLADLFKNLK